MATTLEQLHQREFNGMKKALDAGMEAAVIAGLRYCRRYELSAPPWLVDELHRQTVSAIRGDKPGKVGRTANPLARLRQDMIHFARWDGVQLIREKQLEIAEQWNEVRPILQKQRELPEQTTKLRKLNITPADMLRELERVHDWVGQTWDLAYRCAAAYLLGTESFASPAAMKASHLLVEQAGKDPAIAARFRLLDHRTLQELGLQYVFEPRPGRKWPPLFDRTR